MKRLINHIYKFTKYTPSKYLDSDLIYFNKIAVV